VNKKLRPEFLNRLDSMVIFHQLTHADLFHIIEIEVGKLQKRLKSRDIYITLDKSVKEFLIDKGFEPEMGARPLRRKIDEYLVDPLTEEILRNPDEEKHFNVSMKGKEVCFEDMGKSDKPKPKAKKKPKKRIKESC